MQGSASYKIFVTCNTGYKLLSRIALNELYHVLMIGIDVNLKRLDRGERMTSQESVVVKNVDKSVGKNV